MVQKELSFSKRNADTGDDEVLGTVMVNYPETVEEAVSSYGEEGTLSRIHRQLDIEYRRVAKSADSPDEAQKVVDAFVPGVTRTRSSSGTSQKALVAALKKLGPEAIQALLAQARAIEG